MQRNASESGRRLRTRFPLRSLTGLSRCLTVSEKTVSRASPSQKLTLTLAFERCKQHLFRLRSTLFFVLIAKNCSLSLIKDLLKTSGASWRLC